MTHDVLQRDTLSGMNTKSPRALTSKQEAVLWVLGQNEPASVADIAYHLMFDDSNARSALAGLERRGLIDRQYTGHYRRSQFAYVVTRRGAEVLNDMDEPEDDPNQCGLCGLAGGKHLRRCAANPRPR